MHGWLSMVVEGKWEVGDYNKHMTYMCIKAKQSGKDNVEDGSLSHGMMSSIESCLGELVFMLISHIA